MDTISIEGLSVDTIIGVHEWEKHNRQRVVIDVDLATDIRAAANTDDLSRTLGYGTVARSLTSYIGTTRFNLIETLAEKIAELLFNEFEVNHVRIRVSKPGAVENADNVAVTIERDRP